MTNNEWVWTWIRSNVRVRADAWRTIWANLRVKTKLALNLMNVTIGLEVHVFLLRLGFRLKCIICKF